MNEASQFYRTRFRARQIALVENEMCSAVSSMPLKTITVFRGGNAANGITIPKSEST